MKRSLLFGATALVVLAGLLAVMWQRSQSSNGSPEVRADTIAAVADADVVTAGDVGWCSDDAVDAVAGMILQSTGTVVVPGDLVYPNGSAEDFADCYDPLLGSVRDRTLAVPGNHDYRTPGARGYFDYTGAEQYYRREVDGWSFFFLDSNCDVVGACDPGTAQYEWLKAELDKGTGRCAAAVWHHPRWSSNEHGPNPMVGPLYELLVDHGVDVLLSGHDHGYERFAPLDASGSASDTGVRQFVVGTGGAEMYTFGDPQPGSEVRRSGFGVMTLDLTPDSYSWQFIDTDGATLDRGNGACT